MRFPPELASIADARHFVGACLDEWGHDEQAHDAILLTSELMTNAVLHGGPHVAGEQIVLEVDLTDLRAHVEVRDHGPGMPCATEGSDEDESGRGLFLVDAVSSEWGVIQRGTWKSVWFEVAAPTS